MMPFHQHNLHTLSVAKPVQQQRWGSRAQGICRMLLRMHTRKMQRSTMLHPSPQRDATAEFAAHSLMGSCGL